MKIYCPRLLKKQLSLITIFFFTKLASVQFAYQQQDFSNTILKNLNLACSQFLTKPDGPLGNKLDIFTEERYNPTFREYAASNNLLKNNFYYHATAFILQTCFCEQKALSSFSTLFSKFQEQISSTPLNFYVLNTGAILGCTRNEGFNYEKLLLQTCTKKINLINLFFSSLQKDSIETTTAINISQNLILEKMNLCSRLLFLSVIAEKLSPFLDAKAISTDASQIYINALTPIFANDSLIATTEKIGFSNQDIECLNFMIQRLWTSLQNFVDKLTSELSSDKPLSVLKNLKNLALTAKKIVKRQNNFQKPTKATKQNKML